ncbi:MAG: L,D-transpeptidase family protein [Chitinophagaceae bacterium]
MKIIFVAATITSLFLFSCKNNDNNNGSDAENAEREKKMTARDYSITPENAYSDLFLDSAAMENYIAEQKLSDSVSRRMRSFYNARNYQYAWFSTDGLTEQARCFWNQYDYATSYGSDTALRDKAFQKKMDGLIAEDTIIVGKNDKSYLQTELALTRNFIEFIFNNYEKGFVKRKEQERFIPLKKQGALYLADSLLNKKHKDDKYYEDVNESYGGLKQQLALYYQVAKQGGWPEIKTDKKQLKKGDNAPEIALIKKRLQLTRDMAAGDSSTVFTDTLEAGVKSFQQRHGYTPDGVITAPLVKQMNVPAEKRLQQILINMNRMIWMPHRPEGTLIVVNIPEFVLHATSGKNKLFDMNVVVGKEGHNTMMFNGDLNQVVFSPYWNVPSSIVKKEILPAMNRNSGYLASKNMEVTGNAGGLPVVRQRPGPKNALGKVKFLFPNSFNIYFHDTPEKSLFEKDVRAYSHGCIRLSDPVKMANWLLENDPEWTPEKINEAMNSGNEKFVKLKNAVPVIITYYTAWVGEDGRLNFRDDIYAHDDDLIRKMFIAGR